MERPVCTSIIELGGMDFGWADWISYITNCGVLCAGIKSTPLAEYVDVAWNLHGLDIFSTGIVLLFEGQSCILAVI